MEARGWWPPAAQQRFAEARQLAQQGRYAEASEAYRSVAEWPDGTIFPQRAEALFLAGLMQEHAHNYERAVELYREVGRRFPENDCTSNVNSGNLPGALVRGGFWNGSTFAGVFAVNASAPPRRSRTAASVSAVPASSRAARDGEHAADALGLTAGSRY